MSHILSRTVLSTVQEFVDLVVTMNNGVKFSKHVAKVAVKGHRMANLILKCFLFWAINSLVRAFTSHNIKIMFARAWIAVPLSGIQCWRKISKILRKFSESSQSASRAWSNYLTVSDWSDCS